MLNFIKTSSPEIYVWFNLIASYEAALRQNAFVSIRNKELTILAFKITRELFQ